MQAMRRSVEEIKKEAAGIPLASTRYLAGSAADIFDIELRDALTAGIPLDRLEALCQAERAKCVVVLDEGLALAMCAGARAIEQRGRGTYVWDVLGAMKEMPYALASTALRDIAVPFLNGDHAAGAAMERRSPTIPACTPAGSIPANLFPDEASRGAELVP